MLQMLKYRSVAHLNRGDKNYSLKDVKLSIAIAGELKDSFAQARALHTAGRLHYDIGEYDNALDCFSDSLKRWMNIKEQPDSKRYYDALLGQAKTCRYIGLVYDRKGSASEAQDYLQQAREIHFDLKNLLEQGRGPKDIWRIMVNKRGLVDTLLSFDEISRLPYGLSRRDLYEKVLKEVKELASESYGDEGMPAHIYNRLLWWFVYQGKEIAEPLKYISEFSGKMDLKMEDLFNDVIQIRKRIGDKQYLAKVYLCRGIYEQREKRYETAEDCFKNALKLNEEFENSRGAAKTRWRLGNLCLELKMTDEAKGYYAASLEMLKESSWLKDKGLIQDISAALSAISSSAVFDIAGSPAGKEKRKRKAPPADFRKRVIMAQDLNTGEIVFRGNADKFKRMIFKLDNVKVKGDRLISGGRLFNLQISFGNKYSRQPVTYEIHRGQVVTTTVILRDKNGKPLIEDGLKRAINIATGSLQCHLPAKLHQKMLSQLDNVKVEGDRLKGKGKLFNSQISFGNKYSRQPVTYEIHRGQVVTTTVILRDKNGKPLIEGGLKRAINIATGSLQCHLPERLHRKLESQLDNVKVEGDKIMGDGQLFRKQHNVKLSKYSNHPVIYKIRKAGRAYVWILDEKGEQIVCEEELKVARDSRGIGFASYRGRSNNLLPKFVIKQMPRIARIEGGRVEKGNLIILSKDMIYDLTRWGNMEDRPLTIVFANRSGRNIPNEFILEAGLGQEQITIPAPQAFSYSQTSIFSGIWTKVDEVTILDAYSPYPAPEQEAMRKEMEAAIEKAIKECFNADEQPLVRKTLDTLSEIIEEYDPEGSSYVERAAQS